MLNVANNVIHKHYIDVACTFISFEYFLPLQRGTCPLNNGGTETIDKNPY